MKFHIVWSFVCTVGISVCFLAGASHVHAQVEDSTRLQRDTSNIRLEPITVTGILNPPIRTNLGYALSIIPRERLTLEPTPDAVEPLRFIPGTFVDEANGPGGPTIVRLRGGEEVFTQILVDGIQINQNGGFFDFQGFTLTNIDRIEVARGPQSAMYGSSAVSGVVQYLTRRGTVGRPRFEFLTEGGDATHHGGNFRSTLTVGGGSQTLRYSAGVGAVYTRGYFAIPHDTWSRDVSLRMDAEPSSRVTVTGIFRFVGMESNVPVRDPGATRVSLDPNARNGRDRWASSIQATLNPGSTWRHRVSASVFRDDFFFEDVADDISSMGPLDFFVFDASFLFKSDLWRSKLDYLGTIVTPTVRGTDLMFSYGVALEREDLFNETSGDFTGEIDFARTNVSAFGEVQAGFIDRVTMLAGARLEKYEALDATITPRVSVVGNLTDHLALRGAIGKAFKVPDLQQQFVDNPFIEANPTLEPETSVSWEVGFRLSDDVNRWSLDAAYFSQDFDNLIRTVAQPGSERQINRNLGKSQAEGFEVDFSVRPSQSVAAGLAGAWIQTEILENSGLSDAEFPVGAELPFRPDAIGTAFVQLTPTDAFNATVRGIYVGHQTVLTERFSGARADVESVFLTNATAQLRVRPNVWVYAQARNLFDTKYETAFDRHGIPLTISLGARIAN